MKFTCLAVIAHSLLFMCEKIHWFISRTCWRFTSQFSEIRPLFCIFAIEKRFVTKSSFLGCFLSQQWILSCIESIAPPPKTENNQSCCTSVVEMTFLDLYLHYFVLETSKGVIYKFISTRIFHSLLLILNRRGSHSSAFSPSSNSSSAKSTRFFLFCMCLK